MDFAEITEEQLYNMWLEANSAGKPPFATFRRQWLDEYRGTTGRYHRLNTAGQAHPNLSTGKPKVAFQEAAAVLPVHWNLPSSTRVPRMREQLLNSESLTWSAIDPSSTKGMALRASTQSAEEKRAAQIAALTGKNPLNTLAKASTEIQRREARKEHAQATLGIPTEEELAMAMPFFEGLREQAIAEAELPAALPAPPAQIPIPIFHQEYNPYTNLRYIYITTLDAYGNQVIFMVHPTFAYPTIQYMDPTGHPTLLQTLDIYNNIIYVPFSYLIPFVPNVQVIASTPLPPIGVRETFTLSGGRRKNKSKKRSQKKRSTRRK